MSAPKAILIDMDDTLFDEMDYVKSGFRAVAVHLQQTRGLPADDSYPAMLAVFEQEGRGMVFDRVIERLGVRGAEGLVQECVDVYRYHMPDIQPYSGARQTLKSLSAAFMTALVTNGLPLMQRRKLAALNIEAMFDRVIFCDEAGKPKPDPAGLMAALSHFGLHPHEALMIGDNPVTDGAAAASAGIPFVRVRTARFAKVDNGAMPLAELSSILDLPTLLDSMRAAK